MKIVISYAFVDGFTRIPRDEAIERLKRAIADADGVIVDFAFFTGGGAAPETPSAPRASRSVGEAIRLTVEVDAGALPILREALAASEIELFSKSSAELDNAKRMEPSHPILAMLHVAFLPLEAEVGATISSVP